MSYIIKKEGVKPTSPWMLFSGKFSSRVGEHYLVYTQDLRKDGETTLLPVYMTGLI